MKAWVLEKQAPIETKPLSLQELPVPEVGEGRIRVRVHACGVCRTDIHVAEGDLPLIKLPLILAKKGKVEGHPVVKIAD